MTPPLPHTRFYVNLLCSDEEGSEAALHFNPRLDESVVVFNTKERGAWGKEERSGDIPFKRGQPFDVLLISAEEGFKVRLCHRGGCQDPGHSCRWRSIRPLVELGSKGVAKAGQVVPSPSHSRGAILLVSEGKCVQGKDKASKSEVPRGWVS